MISFGVFVFLKSWPSSCGFNKLVIKVKMHVNTYFLSFDCMKIRYDFFLFFEILGRMQKKKVFFPNVLMKLDILI